MRIAPAGVSAHCLPGFDPDVHLPLLAARGIDLFEINMGRRETYEDDAQFETLCGALAANNVTINSLHVPYARWSDPWVYLDFGSADAAVRTEALETAALCTARLAQAGGKYLVVHPGGPVPPQDDRRDHLDRSADCLGQIRDSLPAGANLQIAIEILPRTNLCNRSDETLAFLERLNDPVFGLCLDTNHMNFQEDVLVAAAAYAPVAFTTHICDNDGENERHWMPGKGVIPWRDLIDTLLAGGYTGPFVYEISAPKGTTTEQAIDELAASIDELFGPADETAS